MLYDPGSIEFVEESSAPMQLENCGQCDGSHPIQMDWFSGKSSSQFSDEPLQDCCASSKEEEGWEVL